MHFLPINICPPLIVFPEKSFQLWLSNLIYEMFRSREYIHFVTLALCRIIIYLGKHPHTMASDILFQRVCGMSAYR